MDELKPCPFCGGKAKMHGNDMDFTVICSKCGASATRHIVTSEGAKDIWNRRAFERQEAKPDESD